MALKKFIAFLFIALVLTNLVHNSIPHHHHMGDAYAHECCDHQACDMDNMASLKDCTHCEAFNGMEYFPSPKNIKVRLLKFPGSALYYHAAALPYPVTHCSGKLYAFADPPDPYKAPDPGITSLRGPPCYG